MENRALQFQLGAKLIGIDKISVVCKRHASFDMIDDDRLRVVPVARAGRAVAHMADRHIAHAKLVQILRCKHVVDKTDILISVKNAVVVHHDAAAFLPSVLEGKKSVIGHMRDIVRRIAENAEYAAFFPDFTH